MAGRLGLCLCLTTLGCVPGYAWLCFGLRLIVTGCLCLLFFFLLVVFVFIFFVLFFYFLWLSRVWRGFEVVTMYHTHIHTYITHIVHKSQMYPLTSAPSNSPPHPTRIYFSIFLCIFLKVSVQEGEGRRACINEGMRMCCGVSIYFLSTYIPVLYLKYAYLRLASISNIYINF